ncbi:hypothetical protein, partial [Roseibacillus persicicus]|uniref:hypothetical protein n=1 Tax=Roseibacillus persicicus TaxID=454148 RepID=UPI001E3EF557
ERSPKLVVHNLKTSVITLFVVSSFVACQREIPDGNSSVNVLEDHLSLIERKGINSVVTVRWLRETGWKVEREEGRGLEKGNLTFYLEYDRELYLGNAEADSPTNFVLMNGASSNPNKDGFTRWSIMLPIVNGQFKMEFEGDEVIMDSADFIEAFEDNYFELGPNDFAV